MPATLLDTNVLVHAAYKGAALHEPAVRLVAVGFERRGIFCLAPQNLVELAAVVTRARFVNPPMHAADLARITARLYRSRILRKIYPQRGTVRRALHEGVRLGITGPAWYDLFLAATMRDNDVDLLVTENVSDFGRIPFVRALRIEEAAAALPE